MYSVNITSRHMENLTTKDVSKLKKIMGYLNGTRNLEVKYSSRESNVLVAYSDSDYVNDEETRRSM